MRTLALAFLFCLISPIVNAQSFQMQKPMICDRTETVLRALNETWKEQPLWIGKDLEDGIRFSLFVNEKTKSWTLIQFTKEIACVIGLGEASEMILSNSI